MDPRMPLASQCVLSMALQQQLTQYGSKDCIRFHSSHVWQYQEAIVQSQKVAATLVEHGVKPKEVVLVWLPNGPDLVAVILALGQIGAVYMPLNVASKGHLLEQAIALSQSRLLIADAALAGQLQAIDTTPLEQVIISGDKAQSVCIDNLITSTRLYADTPYRQQVDVEPWDTAAIILTSGTTGPSKGVLVSHIQLYKTALHAMAHVTDTDIILSYGALNHIAGLACLYIAILRGATLVLEAKWQTDRVWPLIAQHQVTTMGLLGSVMQFLLNQPVTSEEKNNSLKKIYLVPLVGDIEAIRQRFGIDIYSVWNMTETSVPLVTDDNPSSNGLCGKARDGLELRLVDSNDCEVALGEVGELILRSDCPWELTCGYYNNAEATARAWRNGWFHTGDAMTRDAEGNYFFVDRLKDCIRRRGENISSYEIESVALEFDGIVNAAAVAVASEHAEDDVLMVVEAAPDVTVDCLALLSFFAEQLPHYMVPRYIQLIDAMPLTNTNKIKKHQLRDQFSAAQVWDRERDTTTSNNQWRS